MNFNKLDLNLLVVFDAIFNEGSTTKAAERINLSQSAVSNALNRLRYSLKDDLFFRSEDKMKPTPKALELVEPIKKALDLIENSISSETFDPKNSQRTFIFSFPDVAAGSVLPRLVKKLENEAPNIKLITLAPEPGHFEKLKNYDVDFIIGSNHFLETEYQSPIGLSFDEHFDSLLIYSDNYICMGRKGNPFFKKGKIELQNYLDANHIYISIDGKGTSHIDKHLFTLGYKRNRMMSVNYFQVAKEIIKETDCLIALTSYIANQLNSSNEFEIVPLPFKSEKQEVKLIWNKRLGNDPAHFWMRECLHDIRKDIFPLMNKKFPVHLDQ